MRTVLRSRLRHQRRSAASVALAVTIAVAFVAVVLAATASLTRFVEDAAAPRARLADVVVSPGVDADGAVRPIRPADVAALRAVPGVAVVSPVRSAYVSVGWPDGRAWSRVDSLPDDPRLAWFRVVSGRLPATDGEVLLDAATAGKLGIALGDRLPLDLLPVGGGPPRSSPGSVAVSGTLLTTGPSVAGRTVLARGGAVAAWQEATGDAPGDEVLEVGVLADRGADPGRVLAAAAAALPQHEVRTGAGAAHAAAESVTRDADVLGRLLLGFTAIALVVATLVVANTFAIMFAQRTRELALLRCVGATRRQLLRSARGEALVVGLLASVVGALAGNALVVVGAVLLPRFSPVTNGAQAVVGAVTVGAPVVVGVLLTVLAATAPARRATRVAPLAALRPETVAAARRVSRLRVALGALAALAGTGVVLLAVRLGGGPGALVGVLGGSVSVLAVVLVSPVLVPALTRLLGLPVVTAGPIARIAVANTARNPGRSAATSTALFVGVCLISVLSVGATTVSAAVADEIAASRPVDVVVGAGTGGGASDGVAASTDGAAVAFDAGTLRRLAELPGTAAVVGLRSVDVEIRPPAGPRAGEPGEAFTVALAGAPDTEALRRVYRTALPLDDGVLLVPQFAVDTYGGADSRVKVTAGSRIATLVVRTAAGLDTPLTSAAALDRLGAERAVRTVWLRAQDDEDAGDHLSAVQSALPRGASVVGGGMQDRAGVQQILDVLLRVATGLLGVSVLISLVGVGNTLALSVHERSRESAVQRAVGMTRRQLRRGLAVEAALLAVVGCLLGVAVGGLLGWAGAATLATDVAPVSGPVVPWGDLVLVVGATVLSAVLSSVLPGRRAARVRPVEALAQV